LKEKKKFVLKDFGNFPRLFEIYPPFLVYYIKLIISDWPFDRGKIILPMYLATTFALNTAY
jgi:hypothetical protein